MIMVGGPQRNWTSFLVDTCYTLIKMLGTDVIKLSRKPLYFDKQLALLVQKFRDFV